MASKRRKRRESCEGKRRFESRQAAIDALNALWRKDRQRMAYYMCQWCNRWHIGHHVPGR